MIGEFSCSSGFGDVGWGWVLRLRQVDLLLPNFFPCHGVLLLMVCVGRSLHQPWTSIYQTIKLCFSVATFFSSSVAHTIHPPSFSEGCLGYLLHLLLYVPTIFPESPLQPPHQLPSAHFFFSFLFVFVIFAFSVWIIYC